MPPITPEQLAEASTRLDKLTQKLEKTILDDICRRIAKAGTITDTAEWQMMRLKEMGYANEVIEKAIADYTKMSEAEIRQLFFEAGQVSDDFYEEVYSKAGMPFVPLEDNPYMQQFLSAGIEQTNNELVNFTQSMGFAVRQADGTLAFQGVAKTYQSALDLAQMQVATGVFDYTTAIRNATKSLTDSGLQFVDYASGHRNRADVAARRAVLTGISQMTGKVSEQNMQELDTDIVETSAHAGARPDHAVWQGRWFSFSGKSTTYPSLVAETGYGTGAGLKGWNCRHDFYPVIPGISEPSYTDEELANIDPPPIEYNGKTLTYYECTQKQRAMETAMRRTKREIIAAEASGDEDMLTAKSILLRRQREEYAKFSKEAGLLTQNERTQVYGFGKSVAQKARWKAEKSAVGSLTTTSNNVKIKPYEIKKTRAEIKAMIKASQMLDKPVFVDSHDQFAINARNIPPIDGFYDVALHGAPTSAKFFGEDIDAYTLAIIIRNRDDYTPGTKIRLLSCSTGDTTETGDCFAQLLANALGVTVEAPTETIYVNPDGTFFITNDSTGEMGFMKTFWYREDVK